MLLMIVVLLFTLNSICQDTTKVEIPISYIRIANQVFVERDRLEAELRVCREINSISAKVIDTSDTLVNKLNLQIDNLNLIINTNSQIHDLEVQTLTGKYKKAKRTNFVIAGSSAVFIAILILL